MSGQHRIARLWNFGQCSGTDRLHAPGGSGGELALRHQIPGHLMAVRSSAAHERTSRCRASSKSSRASTSKTGVPQRRTPSSSIGVYVWTISCCGTFGNFGRVFPRAISMLFIVEQLIGRSIFIRYLEDRGILSQEHLLELGEFQSFVQTLRAGPDAVEQSFETLRQHFNGDVFALSNTETHLPSQAIDDLFQFFSGTDLRTGRQAPWPYDSNVIPPELISSIYEQLLSEKQRQYAAYYTPSHLVDLVLDELVPWQADTAERSVLDACCGPGIFLAEAFKRFAYQHTIANGQPPSFDGLSGLLTRCVYGVDASPVAIGVAALSLSLALLEHVDPPTAWRDARLPRTGGPQPGRIRFL